MGNVPDKRSEAVQRVENRNDLPRAMKIYVRGCYQQNRECPLLDSLTDKGTPILDRFANLFSEVIRILGVSLDQLPRIAHFDSNDLDASKFDSFIAELRSIVFLIQLGFRKVEFVRESNKPRPDLIAEYKGQRFIIEVATADHDAIRVPTEGVAATFSTSDGELVRIEHGSPHSLTGYFRRIYENKKRQLSWRPDNSPTQELLVFVLNNLEARGLGTRSVYELTLQTLHTQVGGDPGLHFSVITGMVCGLTGESDDCIWPPID